MKKYRNFLAELAMIVMLLVIYGLGKYAVSAEMNENVVAAVVLMAWIGWLIVKYFLLGYKIKE